ncbi:MAG: type IV pilin protein [Candidatus Microsaccharimonas sp.]
MSFKNIKANQGFTIVELLIVVVVIAILAAITIVSYNGITSQANTSSAKSTAASVQKKIELHYAEKSTWPTKANLIATADSSKPYYIPSATLKVASSLDADNGKDTVRITTCTGGIRVEYYNFDTKAIESVNAGNPTACGTTYWT